MTIILRYIYILKNFGIAGLKLNLEMKFSKKVELKTKLKKHNNLIYLRRKSSDFEVFRQIFRNEEYNFEYSQFLGRSPKFIIDCGANVGLASLFFGQKFSDATIIAVEPEKNNFGMLQKNTSCNSRIIPINKGIWKNTNELDVIDQNLGEWGFVAKESNTNSKNKIQAVTIHDLIKEYSIDEIDILKIDIEGAEYELFEENTEKWLPKVNLLIIELHDNMKIGCAKNLFKAIEKYTYIYTHYGENVVLYFKK